MATLDSIKGVRNPFWEEDKVSAEEQLRASPGGRFVGAVIRWKGDALLMSFWSSWPEKVIQRVMERRYPHARVSVMEMSEQG